MKNSFFSKNARMERKLKRTPEYKKYGYSIVNCPVCGGITLDSYYICPTCDWEYDYILDENEYSDANCERVKDAKERYFKKHKKSTD